MVHDDVHSNSQRGIGVNKYMVIVRRKQRKADYLHSFRLDSANCGIPAQNHSLCHDLPLGTLRFCKVSFWGHSCALFFYSVCQKLYIFCYYLLLGLVLVIPSLTL